jgi:hypothetical protein
MDWYTITTIALKKIEKGFGRMVRVLKGTEKSPGKNFFPSPHSPKLFMQYLCHLAVFSHSQAFWNEITLIGTFVPSPPFEWNDFTLHFGTYLPTSE